MLWLKRKRRKRLWRLNGNNPWRIQTFLRAGNRLPLGWKVWETGSGISQTNLKISQNIKPSRGSRRARGPCLPPPPPPGRVKIGHKKDWPPSLKFLDPLLKPAGNGSFTPKLNLQPTGFRLPSNWLQTSFRLVNAVGLHWCSMIPFTPILESEASREPVWSQSVAILIWCERALTQNIDCWISLYKPVNWNKCFLTKQGWKSLSFLWQLR